MKYDIESASTVYTGWDVFCTFGLTCIVSLSVGFAMGVMTERNGNDIHPVKFQSLNQPYELADNPFK